MLQNVMFTMSNFYFVFFVNRWERERERATCIITVSCTISLEYPYNIKSFWTLLICNLINLFFFFSGVENERHLHTGNPIVNNL